MKDMHKMSVRKGTITIKDLWGWGDKSRMLWNGIRFYCNATRFVYYAMKNRNEGLNDIPVVYVRNNMVCYEFWTKPPSYTEEI